MQEDRNLILSKTCTLITTPSEFPEFYQSGIFYLTV